MNLNKSRSAWTSMLVLQLEFHWRCTTVAANNQFQPLFNRFRASHACNGHLSRTNMAGPPTERCGPMSEVPKYPFVINTIKSLGKLASVHLLYFVLLLCILNNPVLNPAIKGRQLCSSFCICMHVCQQNTSWTA